MFCETTLCAFMIVIVTLTNYTEHVNFVQFYKNVYKLHLRNSRKYYTKSQLFEQLDLVKRQGMVNSNSIWILVEKGPKTDNWDNIYRITSENSNCTVCTVQATIEPQNFLKPKLHICRKYAMFLSVGVPRSSLKECVLNKNNEIITKMCKIYTLQPDNKANV